MKAINKLQEGLLDKNIIDLRDEISGDMAEYVREAILYLTIKESPPITIYITSGGGHVNAGLAIYDFLRLYPGQKTGIVAGFAKSMATIILQACDKRQCMLHSNLLIHHIQRNDVSLDDLRSPEKLKEVRDDLEKSQERLYEILCKKTGQSREKIKEVCEKDIDMTSEEAFDFGLIDEII